MKFFDKTVFIGQLVASITVVDIFRREDKKQGEETGYIWPLFNIDLLTIGNSFGLSITLPIIKISLGWSKALHDIPHKDHN